MKSYALILQIFLCWFACDRRQSGSLTEGLLCSITTPSCQLSDCISPGLSEDTGCLRKDIPRTEMCVLLHITEWCRWARAERCVERGKLQTSCSLRHGFSLEESTGSAQDSHGSGTSENKPSVMLIQFSWHQWLPKEHT